MRIEVDNGLRKEWSALCREARSLSVNHYNSIRYLASFAIEEAIAPQHIDDLSITAFVYALGLKGKIAKVSIARCSIKYWNDLSRRDHPHLQLLSPIANPQLRSSIQWASLPEKLTAELLRGIDSSTAPYAITRYKTNMLSAIACVTKARKSVAAACDLLTVASLDVIGEGIATNAKLASVLTSLSKLAAALDDDAALARVRAISRMEVRKVYPISSCKSLEIDRVISSNALQRLLLFLTGVVLTFCELQPGGHIRVPGSGRRLTRRLLFPRAQAAMAALIVLQSRVTLKDLCDHKFETSPDGIVRLVDRREDIEWRRPLCLGAAATELLGRLHGAIVLHERRQPETFLDQLGSPAKTRSTAVLASGIKDLLKQAGIQLTAQGLRDLSERSVARVAASLAEASVGSGKSRSDTFARRHGCDFHASAAVRFATQELAEIAGEDPVLQRECHLPMQSA